MKYDSYTSIDSDSSSSSSSSRSSSDEEDCEKAKNSKIKTQQKYTPLPLTNEERYIPQVQAITATTATAPATAVPDSMHNRIPMASAFPVKGNT
jgi:hypothetical protein